jgi:hypothetical protein
MSLLVESDEKLERKQWKEEENIFGYYRKEALTRFIACDGKE